jgi:hypothetical protein
LDLFTKYVFISIYLTAYPSILKTADSDIAVYVHRKLASLIVISMSILMKQLAPVISVARNVLKVVLEVLTAVIVYHLHVKSVPKIMIHV